MGSNIVGICAGAYLATKNADLFSCDYSFNNTTGSFNPPKYQCSTFEHHSFGNDLNLDIVHAYQALGPFLPNSQTYLPHYYNGQELHASIGKPYYVDLSSPLGTPIPKQTYFGGCGFERITKNDGSHHTEVVATYHNENAYSFFYPSGKKTTTNESKVVTNMPAIIRNQKALLSGVHLETCVPNSKLLKFFQEGRKTYPRHLPLQNDSSEYNQERSSDFVVDLLKNTLRK